MFLSAFIGAVAAAVAAALAIPLVGYFLSPTFRKQGTTVSVAIARTDEVPVGVPTFFGYEEAVSDGWLTTTVSKGAWVLNKGNNQFVVYDPHCTHLGCAYYWDGGRKSFLCPCHGGSFDLEGDVIGGPPPRPMFRYATRVVDGIVGVGAVARGGLAFGRRRAECAAGVQEERPHVPERGHARARRQAAGKPREVGRVATRFEVGIVGTVGLRNAVVSVADDRSWVIAGVCHHALSAIRRASRQTCRCPGR